MGVLIAIIPFAEEDVLIEPASPSVVAASLVVSHLVSYWYDYLGDREYARRGPVSLAVEPAPRFWALIFCAYFGGVTATVFTRSPIGVLVVFKTCVDRLQHRRDRKRALWALEIDRRRRPLALG